MKYIVSPWRPSMYPGTVSPWRPSMYQVISRKHGNNYVGTFQLAVRMTASKFKGHNSFKIVDT